MISKSYFIIVIILLGLVLVCTNAEDKVFNVLSYGAKADGVTDNSKAFLNAWMDACKWTGKATVLIPSGVYMVYAVDFTGPCKGPGLTFIIKGNLKAPTDPKRFCGSFWISFHRVSNGIEIEGDGTLDGQGASAWGKHKCATLPSTLQFSFVENAVVHDIHSKDSKGFHFNLFRSNNIRFSHVDIKAPQDSPNTDGIHISYSTDIKISNSNIGTGDDCISMIEGSKSINITEVICGPGHGISVGSLGRMKPKDIVKDIHVKSCTLIGTKNGARIKTWAPSDVTSATTITFDDIRMQQVKNPILIDQHYCPSRPCGHQESSVQIKDVTFNNIRGTSSSVIAVMLNCSASSPCQGIKLNDINLAYHGPGGPAISSCANAKGTATGIELPPSCLK